MTLKTTLVTGTLYRPDGTPAAKVKGTAKLTQQEVDDGIVVPSLVTIETDDAGQFSVDLWPNARGVAGSQYLVQVAHGRTVLLHVHIVVPDVDEVRLADIINQAPYPPVDQGQQAVADARAAALEALGYRDAARDYAEQAEQFADEMWGASQDLFRHVESDLFSGANLTVRRYTGDDAFTDYPAGYGQAATAEGLRIAIPVAGSASIRHYARTGVQKSAGESLTVRFSIESLRDESSAAGIGYLSDDGRYVAYVFSASGVPRRINNNASEDLNGITIPWGPGDVLEATVRGSALEFRLNGDIAYAHQLAEGEFDGKDLLIGQSSFPQFVASLELVSDPIRDYVQGGAANTQSMPKGFYEYLPSIGFRAYTKISGNRYAGFDIIHDLNMSEITYVDYWRVGQARAYRYNGRSMVGEEVQLLAGGENECVWKRNTSKDDFTGGHHGDEILESVEFFASGVRLDIDLATDVVPLTPCEDFYYLIKSTMHATAEGGVPIAGHPVECRHVKQTYIRRSGYETFNRLTWEAPGLVTLWYHGISCIGKDCATTAYTDGAFTPTEFDGSGGQKLEAVGDREMYSWDDGTGLSAYVTSAIKKPIERDSTATLFISDRAGDSKYYRRQVPLTVSQGDIWESVMRVTYGAAHSSGAR